MDSDDTLQQSAVSEPTGQQLKRAREQKGLSIAAVADAQHLRPAVIQAIENGDYHQIDSELFLKGYVRTYAKQVDLDPDAVIATLDEELEPLRQQRAEAEQANPLVDIERRRRQKRRIAKLFLFLLAIAVIGYLGLRFMGELDGIGEDTAEPGVATQAESPEPSEQGDEAELIDNEAEQPVADSQPELLTEEPIVAESAESEELTVGIEEQQGGDAPGLDEELVDTVPEPTSPGEPRLTDEIEPTGVSPTADDVDESRVPVVTSTPEPTFQESAQPDAAAGTGRLEMTFSDECWVQVTDSAGNRLVGSLQRDGDQINVSGRLPIDVVVGAVDAIESIRFEGEPVDLSGFRVINNRAEFTLDI